MEKIYWIGVVYRKTSAFYVYLLSGCACVYGYVCIYINVHVVVVSFLHSYIELWIVYIQRSIDIPIDKCRGKLISISSKRIPQNKHGYTPYTHTEYVIKSLAFCHVHDDNKNKYIWTKFVEIQTFNKLLHLFDECCTTKLNVGCLYEKSSRQIYGNAT